MVMLDPFFLFCYKAFKSIPNSIGFSLILLFFYPEKEVSAVSRRVGVALVTTKASSVLCHDTSKKEPAACWFLC